MHIVEKDAMLWRMEAERLAVSQNIASAVYLTMQQALAMGLRAGNLSEIVKVSERTADYQLPPTRE